MKDNKKVTIRYDKRALIRFIVALVCMIFSFTSWFKITGIMKIKFSLFNGSMYIDALLFHLAKYLLIISFIIFAMLLVVTFVDIKKIVKESTMKYVKYLSSTYFTLVLSSSLLCLLGTIVVTFSKYFHPAYGWYISLVFSIIGLLLSTKKTGKTIYKKIGL